MTYSSMYAFIVVIGMYGLRAINRKERVVQACMSVSLFAFFVGLILAGFPVDHLVFDVVPPLIGFVQWCLSAHVIRRVSGSTSSLIAWQWLIVWIALGFGSVMYGLLVPMIVTAKATVPQLGMFRFVLHPAFWALMLFFCRHTLSRLKARELSSVNLIMVPVFMASIYGQFLLLQLESAGSIFVIRLCLACLFVLDRLVTRTRSASQLKALNQRAAAEALLATREEQELGMAETFSIQVGEMLAVVANALLFILANITEVPGVKPSYSEVFTQSAVQVAVILCETCAGLYIDVRFHSIPVSQHWRKMTRRTMAFLCLALGMGMMTEIVKLFLFFCPKYYDGEGVLLEYCNRPSLFQAEIVLNQPVTGRSPGVVSTFGLDGALLFSGSEL